MSINLYNSGLACQGQALPPAGRRNATPQSQKPLLSAGAECGCERGGPARGARAAGRAGCGGARGACSGGAAARPGAGTVAQPCFFQLLLCHVMLFVWAYLLRLGAQHAVVPMHMPVLRALAGGQSDCCRVCAPLGWMRVSGVMTCKQHGQPKGRKLGLSQKF